MKFSIILPAYNAEKTIFNALESLRSQIYNDFEVIIIDDGSKDDTSKICNLFVTKDERFNYYYQPNQGVSVARNNGIEHATGDYIAFLDSDDAFSIDYLSSFATLIEKHPNFDNYWCHFDSTKTNTIYKTIASNKTHPEHELDRNNLMHIHQKFPMGVLWNKIYKSNIIKNNKIKMPIDLSLGEDQMFNLEYLDHARPQIIVIEKPLYLYTQNANGSLDTKFRSDLINIYERLNYNLFTYLKKWNSSEEELQLYYNRVFYSMENVLYNTFHEDSTLTKRERYSYNKQLLKSEKFKRALLNSNCHINKFYRFAYIHASWRLIRILDKCVYLKNKLKTNEK